VIVVDTNILLAAFRADLPRHREARSWVLQKLTEGENFCIPNVVQVSFLRLSTRSLGPLPPAGLTQAAAFLDALSPFDESDPAQLRQLAIRLCDQYRLSGDGTVDAWIAAHAIARAVPLASFDRGFLKYQPTLSVMTPSPASRNAEAAE
jgi:predicted nucleic acid-binding protein